MPRLPRFQIRTVCLLVAFVGVVLATWRYFEPYDGLLGAMSLWASCCALIPITIVFAVVWGVASGGRPR